MKESLRVPRVRRVQGPCRPKHAWHPGTLIYLPLAMHCSRPIDTLVGMGTKGVALGLRQALRQPRSSIRVKVAERRGMRQHWNACAPRAGDGPAPPAPGGIKRLANRRVEQQVDPIRLGLERVANGIEQPCADNTTSLPDSADLREVDVPAVLVGPRSDQRHPLCIAE